MELERSSDCHPVWIGTTRRPPAHSSIARLSQHPGRCLATCSVELQIASSNLLARMLDSHPRRAILVGREVPDPICVVTLVPRCGASALLRGTVRLQFLPRWTRAVTQSTVDSQNLGEIRRGQLAEMKFPRLQ